MLKFSLNETSNDDKRALIVEALSTLVKMGINKKAETTKLLNKYSVVEEDYAQLNASVIEKVLSYSKEQSNLPEAINVLTKEGLTRAMTNKDFEWNFFSIQAVVLQNILADTEVLEAMDFVNAYTVGLGDSMTFEVGSKALYDVEDTSYGNKVTRPRKHFAQPITIVPSPKQASVQFDFIQMVTSNYDFGAEMAKIVLSIRAKQYQDAVDMVFNTTPLTGTPFYKATFNKVNYTELADRLQAVNNSPVIAHASRRAFADASEVVTTGFTVQDELTKKTYIADLYNVPSRILGQAVDTSNASYTFRVPNDKILLLSTIGDKPIKLVQEDYMEIELSEGKNIKNKVYKYIYSYNLGLVLNSAYGIQEV
jgi:DNA-binding transcriptional ArsR family regulator